MDTITAELLIDSLNVAKVVYKKGLTGTIILGDKRQKIFTALPEYFTVTDYDISVVTSSELIQDLEQIKAVVPDFIKSGQLPADILFEIITCKSPSDIKIKIRKALKKQKEENNTIQQLQQQLQEAQQQLQQLQNENSQLKSKVEALNEKRLQLDAQKIQLDNKVNMFKAQTDRDYKTIEAQVDQDKVKIEQAQLYDNNPYNDKIRMS
jgi:predicted nuclease with TOPRIM domain